MQVIKLILSILAGASIGCSQDPTLRPRVILQQEQEGKQFWLSAPYLVSVKILSADIDRSSLRSVESSRDHLELVKFTAEVETMITGGGLDRTIQFYFYAKPDQRPHYWLDPGKRYVVALRREGSVLRSMADATQLALRVYSGKHDQDKVPVALGPGPSIVYVLLTPGLDCDIADFSRHLVPDQLDEYASPQYIGSLMMQLQNHPDRGLRDRACVATAQTFWIRPNCLSLTLDNPDPDVRESARGLLDDRADKINVVERLKVDPMSLMPAYMSRHIAGRLEMFTLDARPEVRRLACDDLNRIFPQTLFPACKDRAKLRP